MLVMVIGDTYVVFGHTCSGADVSPWLHGRNFAIMGDHGLMTIQGFVTGTLLPSRVQCEKEQCRMGE